MKILIIEDKDEKFKDVCDFLNSHLTDCRPEVERSTVFSDATRKIYQKKYDLILIDILMPRRENDAPSDISDEIVANLQDSGINSTTTTIALSMHRNVVDDLARKFHESGIILLHYSQDGSSWKDGLSICLQRVKIETAFDFIIICALEKERSAFKNTNAKIGQLKTLFGLDCQEIFVDDWKGLIVKPSRMGLVDGSITSARALEKFSPKLICMSGICAGFSDQISLGSLVVSERAWEHQAGKWSQDGFKLNSYQSSINDIVRLKIDQFTKSSYDFSAMRNEGFIDKKISDQPFVLSPTVSGSAVIASSEKIEEISRQHGKLVALDMEVFGLYRAVELSAQRPMFFAAKTVVDLADDSKGDDLHLYGSVLSARFVVETIRILFSD